jgi:hypothetical protein
MVRKANKKLLRLSLLAPDVLELLSHLQAAGDPGFDGRISLGQDGEEAHCESMFRF